MREYISREVPERGDLRIVKKEFWYVGQLSRNIFRNYELLRSEKALGDAL